MKGEIRVYDSEDFLFAFKNFEFDFFDDSFILKMVIKDYEDFYRTFCNRKDIINNLLQMLLLNQKDPASVMLDDYKKLFDYYSNNDNDTIYNNIEYVVLEMDHNKALDFICRNPKLLDKKIVLNNIISINDYNKVLDLKTKFHNILDNIYVMMEGNNNYISLRKCFDTVKTINDYKSKIDKYNFSPLEGIMYIYDDLKSRMFQEEKENEDARLSRDLSEVLFNDKIVCEGYANIFASILNILGINNKIVYLDSRISDKGHARNCIYVNDPKYNVDGVYFFDATFDSRMSEDDKMYPNYFRFFAKPIDYFQKIDGSLVDALFEAYNKDIYNQALIAIKTNDLQSIKFMYKTINNMGRMVGEENLLDLMYFMDFSPFYGKFNIEEFEVKFKNIVNKFNKVIPAETLILLYNNVKKVEYYESDKEFNYNINYVYDAAVRSNWQFKDEHDDKKQLLLKALFEDEYEVPYKEKFINYVDEVDLRKNIKEVQLTKVLRKTLERKMNNE